MNAIFDKNKSFSITREESEQLEKEYEINDVLAALYKALGMVGPDKTINETIEILSKKTRFAEEVAKTSNGYTYGKYISSETTHIITNETTEEEIRSWDPEYYDFMKQYEKDHCSCPECGSRRYTSTLLGFLFDKDYPEEFKDGNMVRCLDCGWHGIVHDLVSEKENN